MTMPEWFSYDMAYLGVLKTVWDKTDFNIGNAYDWLHSASKILWGSQVIHI